MEAYVFFTPGMGREQTERQLHAFQQAGVGRVVDTSLLHQGMVSMILVEASEEEQDRILEMDGVLNVVRRVP